MMRRFRLAAVTSHPVQYQAPLFASLAKQPDIDLTVFYGHDASLHGALDPGFGIPVSWDRPLLDGYRSVFLTRGLSALSWRRSLPIIKQLHAGDFDAVFIHSYATPLALLAYAGAVASRTPILLRTESHRLHPRGRMFEMIKAACLKPLFWWTGAFLSIGTLNREFFRHYGVPASALFSTPYSVDNDFFMSERTRLAPERTRLRAELGFDGDDCVVVYSGKLIGIKRVDVLLRAAAICQARGAPIALLIVGDGANRQQLEQLADQLGLRRIRFVGFQNQSELPRMYVRGDVLVLPSDFEPWGLVVNEGMACGMPVIASTNVGAARDLVVPGRTGALVPPGDIDAVAEVLTTWSSDSDLRRRLGDQAGEHVRGFSIDACVSGIRQALQAVVAS